MEQNDLQYLQQLIQLEHEPIEKLRTAIQQKIIGQDYMVSRLLIAILGNGHVLLEGLPGLAKTLAIKTMSQAIGADFKRVQFTPDLMPGDIVGTMIYNPSSQSFSVKKGPVFANLVLADEINRAPAKVQSALLEAMEERQVTIGNERFKLEEPFLVMATQNPIEQEGTYPLPEAQTDRFMLKVNISYPGKEEEKAIIRMNLDNSVQEKIAPVVDKAAILKAREVVGKIYMDEKIEQYIVDLIHASRYPEDNGMANLKPLITFGGSPRASINLAKAAKCAAFLEKRAFVIPEDVRAVAHDVLRHRIGLTYEAEAEELDADHIVEQLLTRIDIP